MVWIFKIVIWKRFFTSINKILNILILYWSKHKILLLKAEFSNLFKRTIFSIYAQKNYYIYVHFKYFNGETFSLPRFNHKNQSMLKINIFVLKPYIYFMFQHKCLNSHNGKVLFLWARFQFRCAENTWILAGDHQLRWASHYYRVPIFRSLHRTQSLSCAKINQPCARSAKRPSAQRCVCTA